MRNNIMLRLLGALLAVAILGVACSSGNAEEGTSTTGAEDASDTSSEDMSADTADAPAVDTQAATLSRDLTFLLSGHEYLAGITVVMGVSNGLDSPEFEAAAKALDDNTLQLADAISSVYGEAGGKQFTKLWRAHIGFFVDYTAASATGDKAGTAKAKKNLDGYRNDFGAFIEGATEGGLPADAVADALTPHVSSTLTAIDAVVAGDTQAFEKLRTAASHLPGIGTTLATAIAEQKGLEGSADDAAANLNRDLSFLLSGHEYLAGIAVYEGVTNGPDSPQFKAAAGALDGNSQDLAKAISSVYGEAGGKQFLKLWRAHIGFFVDYTLAKAGGDKAGIAEAKKNLDGYRNDFGAFIEGATEGGLPADAVADALTPHVSSTITAIDAVIAGDGTAFDKLQKATTHLPGIGTTLAGAIVAQFPEKF